MMHVNVLYYTMTHVNVVYVMALRWKEWQKHGMGVLHSVMGSSNLYPIIACIRSRMAKVRTYCSY